MSTALRLVAAVALVTAVGVVLNPALDLELTGDDYQIAQQAHEGLHRPAALVAPIGQFIRPVTVWVFAVNRVLWGTDPFGYHLANLILHAVAALLLVGAGIRLGLPEPIAWGAGAVWALVPFTMEVAVWSAVQHEQTLLLAWLVLVIAWPHPGERWQRARVAVVAGAILLAAVSKETWVVTPALVLALCVVVKRAPRRRTVLIVGFAAALALAYTIARFVAIPTTGGYYRFDPELLGKLPRMLATFLWLEQPLPLPTPLTVRDVVAAGVLAGIAWLAWRRHAAAVATAAALLVAPALPVLFVATSPLRYSHIPFAGFVLLLGAGASAGLAALTPTARRVAGVAALAGTVLVAAAGIATVRATLADWAAVSRAHSQLLAEARAFAPSLPIDRPVVVARLEHENPLLELARAPRGVPQFWYVRHSDPAGLIDAAALFDWVLDRDDVLVVRIDDWRAELAGRPGGVAGHAADGFSWLVDSVGDAAAVAEDLTARGYRLRVIRAMPLR